MNGIHVRNDRLTGRRGRQLQVVGILVVALSLNACDVSKSTGTADAAIQASHFPVVALAASHPALVLSIGRDGDDPLQPVHQRASLYDFESGTLGGLTDLAAGSGNQIVASGRPELSGNNDSLVIDETGRGVAIWESANGQNQIELYANRYTSGIGRSPRELLGSASNANPVHRVAMDHDGATLGTWTGCNAVNTDRTQCTVVMDGSRTISLAIN